MDAIIRLKVLHLLISKPNAQIFKQKFKILQYIKTFKINYGMANMEMQVYNHH